MRISVCICTHNRLESLRRTLQSLAAVQADGVNWEVLVVDNASPASPAPIVQDFRGRLPVRLVAEARPGLSHARNRALTEQRGTHLIFIDDDVTVPPAWLLAYAEGFARYPQAAFFGGPIVPDAPAVSADNLAMVREVMPGVISALEPACGEIVLTQQSKLEPWGANMAFRRSTAEGHLFDAGLGHRSGNPGGLGEDTAFIKALLAEGCTGVWLPQAHVTHHVSAARFSRRNISRYCREVGWCEGRRQAQALTGNAVHIIAWARQEVRKMRWQKRKTPLWASRKRRLEALRDLELARGFMAGLEDAVAVTYEHVPRERTQ